MMYEFCEKHKLPAERCGKMIVAVNEAEHKVVEKLYHQGNANGVKGLEIYNSKKVNYNLGARAILLTKLLLCTYLTTFLGIRS